MMVFFAGKVKRLARLYMALLMFAPLDPLGEENNKNRLKARHASTL
jgi:hypothetical protein